MQVSLSHLFVSSCLALCQATADEVNRETGKRGQPFHFLDLLSPKWQVKSPTGEVNAIHLRVVVSAQGSHFSSDMLVHVKKRSREVNRGIHRSSYVLSKNMRLR